MMKRSEKTVKAVSYVSGITVIAGAMLLAILLVLSLVGVLHPRKATIILYTPHLSRIYDGTELYGSEPALYAGRLHPGHSIMVTGVPAYSEVGVYVNEPVFAIVDDTGANVTKQYQIIREFGEIRITPRMITLGSHAASKTYDGQPLTAEPATLLAGSLVQGHSLISEPGNSLVLPGSETAKPWYQIVTQDGRDVTDQYLISEAFGTLQIRPILLVVSTASAQKQYDGKPLSSDSWKHTAGELLDGHSLHMETTVSLQNVGVAENEGVARVTDADGRDVTALYQIQYQFGVLEVTGIPLYISTGSAQREYDGTPLQMTQWTLTKGMLEPGAVLEIGTFAVNDGIGRVENAIQLVVIAADGTDITSHYRLVYDYGTLTVQPRRISIRTGSAQKVYDGSPLSCPDYEIIGGSLAEGDQLSIICTAITEVGYSDNYVLDCTIYRTDAEGKAQDVSDCYRITFDFGTLKVTAN